jgi:hypothetical protein
MIKIGEAPYLECSSKGDKRFSAFYARIKSLGNKSIEELYQSAKVFEGNITNLSIKEAKGKQPLNTEYLVAYYSYLWDIYIEENVELISVLLASTGLSDIFGQPGHQCQALELWYIRSKYLNNKELKWTIQ